MSIITARLEVAKHYKKTPPQLNLGRGWFGQSRQGESISLNGGKVVAVEFGALIFSKSEDEVNTEAFLQRNAYWRTVAPSKGIDAYAITLSFSSHEDAENAFKCPVYELASGVLLHLSGLNSCMHTSFKNVPPASYDVRDYANRKA
ncbi:hypothetical protein [Vibrio sp. Hal054]|uniref:hypothetical protein n=1 Tax=Vibrio sp. Hal054 TaxID=3035158 RepID=UPI00301E5EBA